MKYTIVTNPVWANPEHTAIDCRVNFDGLGEVPYTASSLDTVDHSKDIFAKACKGVFGIVQEFSIPLQVMETPQPPEQVLAETKLEAALIDGL